METTFFTPMFSILSVLCIIAGLWIAGRLLPSFTAWLKSKYPSRLLSDQFVNILLWIALGALFTLPLLDIITWLRNLVSAAVLPQSGAAFSTMLGTVSPQIYFLFPLLLMAVVYGIILYYGRDYISTSRQFGQVERIFIVLTLASLVYRGVNTIFTQVFSFQLPFFNAEQNYGTAGYAFEVLAGAIAFVIILWGLNRFLSNHPASKH